MQIFGQFFIYKYIEKRKAFLDKLLDTAEETGDLSGERMLNQVDTFMFAVKAILV